MFTLVLAIFSVSAAASMRLALPLLVLGSFYTRELLAELPLIEYFDPRVFLAIGISWSLFELLGSKNLLGQRLLQIFQLLLSPIVGAISAVTVTHIFQVNFQPLWLIALISATFSFVLALVQVGWFFRLRGIPIWLVCVEDLLCISLVVLAFSSPQEGGIIALILFWLAIRSSNAWRSWKNTKPQASNA